MTSVDVGDRFRPIAFSIVPWYALIVRLALLTTAAMRTARRCASIVTGHVHVASGSVRSIENSAPNGNAGREVEKEGNEERVSGAAFSLP